MLHKVKELALPLILILEIILCLSFGEIIPVAVKSGLYALSLTIKEGLLFVLPLIIFCFLLSSVGTLKRGALSFVLLAFTMVIISNFFSTSVAGFLGTLTLSAMDTLHPFATGHAELSPLWDISIPQWVANEKALILGLAVGIVLSVTGYEKGQKLAARAQHYALRFLKLFFIPVIPVFVLGFILKMDYDGILDIIVQHYLSVFLAITVLAFTYITMLYGVAAGFKGERWVTSIRNMIPALVTGFSTMSSASALPLITTAAEKTSGNPLVNGVVPLSINIHMIGDCFSLSILALAIMFSFGYPLPTPEAFFLFTCFFVLARFSVAAVPGGGVIVILPVLEKYLGFSPEMLSLILALYILFDPIATSANVYGNGAFALIFEKIYGRLKRVF